MKTLGIYGVDQDARTTSSLGIYRYTGNLIAALAALPDPGFGVVLWVAEANVRDFVPRACPSWMRVRCLPGSYGKGTRRIWADHVLARELPRHDRVDAVHYPKGWLPLVPPRGIPIIASLHDTITQYYCRQHPEAGATWKWRYFDWMMRRSLRRADFILTLSHDSAAGLAAIVPGVARKVTVVHPAQMVAAATPARVRQEQILVIGSRAPHKATAETLALLDAYAKHKGRRLSVVITGLRDLAHLDVRCEEWTSKESRNAGNGRAWKPAPTSDSCAPSHNWPFAAHLDVRCEGRVSDARMGELFGTSRALVFLSEIEGFGLPLVEAYGAGMPVCYRAVSAMAEVMDGAPGGWDGAGADSFFRAMDEVLGMGAGDIEAIRLSLMRRYDFGESVQKIVGVYRRALGVG